MLEAQGCCVEKKSKHLNLITHPQMIEKLQSRRIEVSRQIRSVFQRSYAVESGAVKGNGFFRHWKGRLKASWKVILRFSDVLKEKN